MTTKLERRLILKALRELDDAVEGMDAMPPESPDDEIRYAQKYLRRALRHPKVEDEI